MFDKLSVFVFVVLSCVLAGKKPNLFSPSDDVVTLDSSNFDKLVHGSHTFWMVDFYNSWCGHCIHFAPTWKAFATDVKSKISFDFLENKYTLQRFITQNNDQEAYPTARYK